MAFPRTVIDGLLKADVLTAPEKIEGAEWSGRVRRVENERSNHVPRASQTQPIRFRPPEGRKGRPKLLERAYQCKVDRIAGQPVPRDRETRHEFVLQNLEAHANGAWED